MSYADQIFVNMCRDILDNGVSTEGEKVRPKWEDGTSAYTIKRFGVVNRYDLRKEFPALTLRRTALKSAMDEILWIWQKKSNNIHELGSRIWDSWADEEGSIGKAYGYQLGVKHQYREGEMDQVDRVLFDLKNNPYSRRIMTNIYVHADLHEMNLYPCAYSMTFNVTKEPGKGCADSQQLECGPVFHASDDDCPGKRHGSRRASACHRRCPHLRPPRAPGGGADCKRTAPGTESMAESGSKRFL